MPVIRPITLPHKPTPVSLLLAVLALGCCSCATSVAISGRIAQPAPPKAPAAHAVRIEESIVYVEALGPMLDRWTPATRRGAAVWFEHGHLEPRVSAAVVGTQLRIGTATASFTARSACRRRRIRPARALTQSDTIGRPARRGDGAHLLRAPQTESADVLVLTHGAWTHPDADGRFTLPPLPRGSCRIHLCIRNSVIGQARDDRQAGAGGARLRLWPPRRRQSCGCTTPSGRRASSITTSAVIGPTGRSSITAPRWPRALSPRPRSASASSRRRR
jgi:hypothetical protein